VYEWGDHNSCYSHPKALCGNYLRNSADENERH
jgi:hypothetical protein